MATGSGWGRALFTVGLLAALTASRTARAQEGAPDDGRGDAPVASERPAKDDDLRDHDVFLLMDLQDVVGGPEGDAARAEEDDPDAAVPLPTPERPEPPPPRPTDVTFIHVAVLEGARNRIRLDVPVALDIADPQRYAVQIKKYEGTELARVHRFTGPQATADPATGRTTLTFTGCALKPDMCGLAVVEVVDRVEARVVLRKYAVLADLVVTVIQTPYRPASHPEERRFDAIREEHASRTVVPKGMFLWGIAHFVGVSCDAEEGLLPGMRFAVELAVPEDFQLVWDDADLRDLDEAPNRVAFVATSDDLAARRRLRILGISTAEAVVTTETPRTASMAGHLSPVGWAAEAERIQVHLREIREPVLDRRASEDGR